MSEEKLRTLVTRGMLEGAIAVGVFTATTTVLVLVILMFTGINVHVGGDKRIDDLEKRLLKRQEAEKLTVRKYKIDKVFRVIDGDTVRVLVDQGFNTYKKTDIQLRGVDAPELRGEEAPAGRSVALVVRYKLTQFKELYVQGTVFGKFGAFVSPIYSSDKEGKFDLATYLLDKRLVEAYDPSSRGFSEEELRAIRERSHDLLWDKFKEWAGDGVWNRQLTDNIEAGIMVDYGAEFGYVENVSEGVFTATRRYRDMVRHLEEHIE